MKTQVSFFSVSLHSVLFSNCQLAMLLRKIVVKVCCEVSVEFARPLVVFNDLITKPLGTRI